MNLKQLLETEIGEIDTASFAKSIVAYHEKFKVYPADNLSLETLDWLTNYILNGRELN